MKIAAYCRVSTDKDEQLDSLAHQKEFFTEYAQKNGHDLFRLYADEGISGTSLKRRAQFQRLMQDARLGLFELVVVKDISRVARNTVDFLQSIRTLKTMGINMIFLTANMTSLGDSEFILTIFGAMAQEESGNLSKRVKWGKKINAKKGRVPQRIFGYDRIDNFQLQINPIEAQVVREIFHLYIGEGLGCRSISLALNARNAKTKFGCDWNPRAVRRVLGNPIYCGHYVNNKYEIEDFLTGRQVPIPEDQHFHHDRPEWAIVTPEAFEQAQRILQSRRVQYDAGSGFTQGRFSSRHLFSTLIKCEHCGCSFCRKSYTYTNTRSYWKCRTNDQMTAEHCDNFVKLEEDELLDELRRYFRTLIGPQDRFVADVLKALERRIPKEEHCPLSRAGIEAQLVKLNRKKEKYQEMYANDLITLAELKAKTAEIMEELRAVESGLAQMERAAADRKDAGEIVRQYAGNVLGFLALENAANQDLRKLIESIRVNRDGTVRIFLKKLADMT